VGAAHYLFSSLGLVDFCESGSLLLSSLLLLLTCFIPILGRVVPESTSFEAREIPTIEKEKKRVLN